MSLAGFISVAIVLVGTATVVLGVVMFLGRRRSTDPECPRCRYALAGLPGADAPVERFEPITCPECGHTAQKRKLLYRRKRRPAWLLLVALGIAVTIEPLLLGNARRVYDHLPNASIVHLHAHWNDEYAAAVVEHTLQPRFRVVRASFSDAHMLTLGQGAITRIERANARGKPGRIAMIDVLILSWLDAFHPGIAPPAFGSRVARAMPPLFAHPDDKARRHAIWLSRDRVEPARSVPAVVAAHSHPDPRVRAAAAVSLYDHLRYGQDVANEFVRLLDDPDLQVRTAASTRLRQHAERFQTPAALAPALEDLTPVHPEAARARTIGLLAMTSGNEQTKASRDMLREGTDDQRWEALLFVSRRPELISALLPEWGKEYRGPIESWLTVQKARPIDEVLEELGFE